MHARCFSVALGPIQVHPHHPEVTQVQHNVLASLPGIPKEPQTPPSCYVTETKDQVRHNGCLSAEQVSVTQCEGTCKTYSLYSAEANSMGHKCSCCREERTTKKAITLNCPDGTTLAHFYIHVESCRCLDTECNEAASSEQTSAKRRRRQLTRK
ncbi:UNVERIFIED_CONTAM: hypothetical protein K2H54_004113 [Gekko kuhli]